MWVSLAKKYILLSFLWKISCVYGLFLIFLNVIWSKSEKTPNPSPERWTETEEEMFKNLNGFQNSFCFNIIDKTYMLTG